MLPGVSSGEAIAAIDRLAEETLPRSMKTEWTELMFMQIRAGNTAIYVFALAVVCVFLALAALYESWSLPLAVILVVPLCLLCSVAGVLYAQHVGEHLRADRPGRAGRAGVQERDPDRRVRQAAARGGQAAASRRRRRRRRLRLRPILMTSFAFILGVVPLVVADGAGAEMRRSLGTAVFSGMLGVTLFGIFLTPVFFYVIQGLGETRLFTAASHALGRLADRWAGCSGWRCGFLLARLGRRAAALGAAGRRSAGVLAALAVLAFIVSRPRPHGRVRRRADDRRAERR